MYSFDFLGTKLNTSYTEKEIKKAFDCLTPQEFLIYPKILLLAEKLNYTRDLK